LARGSDCIPRINYLFENLLRLPNNLCALQLFEIGEFVSILCARLDYDELLELFSFKQVDTMDIAELEKTCKYNLVEKYKFNLAQGDYNFLMHYIDRSKEIVEKVKKRIN
jgi:acyl-CoA-binding protein